MSTQPMDLPEDAPAQCDDCGWTGPASQTNQDIPHLTERIAPGETVPTGECPECGALCHYVAATAPTWTATRKLHDLRKNAQVGPSTLDDALERWAVLHPGAWENDDGPVGWWAVANDDGIVAYFSTEEDACRHRLAMVNRDCNP